MTQHSRTRILTPWRAMMLAACLPLCSMHATAHHSFAAEFNIDKPVEFKGKVLKVELINPHSWIHLEVTDSNGTRQIWMIEGGSPNQLFRKGFTKNSLPVGTELAVAGYQARDGSKRAVGRTLTLANGQPLFFQPTELPKPLH
jgi:Family of unknown function (DUF6152)